MPSVVLAGLGAASDANGTRGTATFANVAIGVPTTPPATATVPCPSGWSCGDIRNAHVSHWVA